MMDDENPRCPECGLILYQPVSQCPRCLCAIGPLPPESPMVERVYVPEIAEKTPKERKDVRRIAMIILVIAVIACLILVLSFHFIIPRLDLKVITQYREGSALSINLDSKIQNDGTLDIQDFSMNITIFNTSGGVVAEGDYYLADLGAHSVHKFDNINFFGDQYEPYHIIIAVNFESDGKEYSEVFEHNVKEYILQRFEDKVERWGG
ncbi:MAG: hypothetical protein JSV09_16820 [Thermoplasmata archaeon]|nr:MAG: hypothetical protein JSV09_16820 [Thermoplasmata archaeon]